MNIDEFDKIILEFSKNEQFLRETKCREISIKKYVELFRVSKFFTLESSEVFESLLIDIRLELFYIEEFDLQCFKIFIPSEYLSELDINKHPKEVLYCFGILQSLIIRSRILFEKIINLIYFTVTKKTLEHQKKTGYFFKELNKPEFIDFNFLNCFKSIIDIFDSKYRTAEVHKKTYFKSIILYENENIVLLINQIFTLINILNSHFWVNFERVLKKEEVSETNKEDIINQCNTLINMINFDKKSV